jgi:hypothetical protein
MYSGLLGENSAVPERTCAAELGNALAGKARIYEEGQLERFVFNSRRRNHDVAITTPMTNERNEKARHVLSASVP